MKCYLYNFFALANYRYTIFPVVLVLCVIIGASCNAQQNSSSMEPLQDSIIALKDSRIIPISKAQTKYKASFVLTDYYKYNKQLDALVDSAFKALNVDQRAAQMIMPASGMKNFGLPVSKLMSYYLQNKIGGILMLKGTTDFFKNQINELNSNGIKNNLPALLYSCDGEPALFHYKFMGQPKMIPAERQLKISDVTRESAKAVKHLQMLGLHINFAPLADNNTNRAIISNRSFGANGAAIIPKASAFISNHQQNNVVSVIKHFPGHGNVQGDSHIGLVKINGELSEVKTFASLIKNVKPIGVMVGHIAVANNAQYNTNNEPATLSYKLVTNLLRNTLDFDGIAFTDAMNMGAVNKIKDASYKAACAGNDVILMPLNVEELHAKIKADLVGNTTKGQQFTKSIQRIIRLKIVLGLL